MIEGHYFELINNVVTKNILLDEIYRPTGSNDITYLTKSIHYIANDMCYKAIGDLNITHLNVTLDSLVDVDKNTNKIPLWGSYYPKCKIYLTVSLFIKFEEN